MDNNESQKALITLKRKLVRATDAHELAVRNRKSHTLNEVLREEINKIQIEIRELKTSGRSPGIVLNASQNYIPY